MSTPDKKLTWESMSAITVGRFAVRVWREESEDIIDDDFNNGDLADLVIELILWDNPVLIAKAFCKLNRVAAVEVLEPDRSGVVVYKGWP